VTPARRAGGVYRRAAKRSTRRIHRFRSRRYDRSPKRKADGPLTDLENGTLVRHNTLGVGKIVALEPNAVHVFFPGGETRFATKLRLPAARPLLRTEGVEPNEWLAGLSAFTLDTKEGRYALAASFMTHEEAAQRFLAAHRGGFGSAPFRAATWTGTENRSSTSRRPFTQSVTAAFSPNGRYSPMTPATGFSRSAVARRRSSPSLSPDCAKEPGLVKRMPRSLRRCLWAGATTG